MFFEKGHDIRPSLSCGLTSGDHSALGAQAPLPKRHEGAGGGALARADRAGFALVLSGSDPDPVWWVRSALASALGAAGDEMSVGVLHAMLRDEDPRVLPAVLEALARARGKDALDTLRRHLEHDDLGVRVAAAEGIAALGDASASPALLAAWRRGEGDGPGELEARIAAVKALAGQKDDAARAGLRRGGAARPVAGSARARGPGPARAGSPQSFIIHGNLLLFP